MRPDPMAAHFIRRLSFHPLAVKYNSAFIRCQGAAAHVQQRALACPIGPGNAEYLMRIDLECQIIQRRDGIESLGDMLHR